MNNNEPSGVDKFKAMLDLIIDGCTLAPDIIFCDCCNTHDMRYATTELTRAEADRELRKCIEARGFTKLCWIYWVGVRLFGWALYYFGKSYDMREYYRNNVIDI